MCTEHSLCWKLNQSPQMGKLYCLPGNAGIASEAECVSGMAAADVPKVRKLYAKYAQTAVLCIILLM